MDTRAVLLAENDRVRDYLRLVVGDLSDSQVRYGHTAVDDRPIGAIVQHLYGSLAAITRYVRTGIPPERRPVEPPATTAEMLAEIDRYHAEIDRAWQELTDADLARAVVLPWRPETTTGANALLAGVAHAHRHIGQIIDARCLGGFQTRALG